jgi:hypothetical protein
LRSATLKRQLTVMRTRIGYDTALLDGGFEDDDAL